MSKVGFIYGKNGKVVMMARRYAETLAKLGHGSFSDPTYQTRMLSAGKPADDDGPLISEAIATFAAEHHVDLTTVVGTGKDGRIKKSDVEAVIAAQDLA